VKKEKRVESEAEVLGLGSSERRVVDKKKLRWSGW
jgi:hypothetical protein